MKKTALGIILAGIFGPFALAAEPCVTDTFDKPVPGAIAVVTRYADVPSPQFPGVWQEGVLDGFSYTLFANGEGVVRPLQGNAVWDVLIKCDTNGADCEITKSGTPPDQAIAAADTLRMCLQGEEGLEPAREDPAPRSSEPAAEVVVEAMEEASATPCGIAAVPEGPTVITVQRLLLTAGADPGPIDGFIGAKTRSALIQVLGEDANGMDMSAALTALDRALCAQ